MSSLVEKNAGAIDLIARILLGFLFVGAGTQKLGSLEATGGYMDAIGIPGGLAVVVAIFEVVGGLAIIVGFWTRLAAFLLGGFCVLSAFAAHLQPDNPVEMAMFMKNIAIAGGFGVLLVKGAGSISIDARSAAD